MNNDDKIVYEEKILYIIIIIIGIHSRPTEWTYSEAYGQIR